MDGARGYQISVISEGNGAQEDAADQPNLPET
jgi:hypothetical protein